MNKNCWDKKTYIELEFQTTETDLTTYLVCREWDAWGKRMVIIDTPLARMDSRHRVSLITAYFPQASEQTIILSTDSEIDRNYYELMKENVGDEFTLKYNEQDRSTRILKGYFQEEL